MTLANPHLLPQGIEDILPDEAHAVEALRRSVLDLYRAWGYAFVITPFIEFSESLFTDAGNSLRAQTLNLTDPLSGKNLGIRADMTLQVARIATARIKSQAPCRLCYIGTVLRAQSDDFASSRSPIQLGCELYGDASIYADIEIIQLMLATLKAAHIDNITLDIGHVGVMQALLAELNLNASELAALLDIIDRRSKPDLQSWQQQQADNPNWAILAQLLDLNGGVEVLAQARQILAPNRAALAAVENLQQLVTELQKREADLNLHLDLADLHGYHYKTGVVFAAYVPQVGRALARGGRYDGIGAAFGKAREATGFSAHLKELSQAGDYQIAKTLPILAPQSNDGALLEMIASLRQAGHAVIQDSQTSINQERAQSLHCGALITQTAAGYQVTPLA